MARHIVEKLVELADVKQQVRSGRLPDDPESLQCYINLALCSAESVEASSEKIRILLNCATVLLDAACNNAVALHWRIQCLDLIYRPLLAAEKLSVTANDNLRVRRFKHRFVQLTPTFF